MRGMRSDIEWEEIYEESGRIKRCSTSENHGKAFEGHGVWLCYLEQKNIR